MAIYSRVPCTPVPCPRACPSHQDIEAAMVHVGSSLRLAVMYCHGKPVEENVVDFVRALLVPAPPGMVTVLCGDFNIDMSHPAAGQGEQLTAQLAALGVTMRNSNKEVTTYSDFGAETLIDAVFSDAPELQVARYQSYFSYHLPLVVSLP